MSEYLDSLRGKMVSTGYSTEYIELCIKYANDLENNNVPVIFDKAHFLLLTGLKTSELRNILTNKPEHYHEFELLVNYRLRNILAPNPLLKQVQKWIQVFILKPLKVSSWATAYKPGTSIIKNAKVHVKQDCVINLDLKNFFDSITSVRVHKIFRSAGYTKELATLFTQICTLEKCLPQGAPTSPYLSNLICRNLDQDLAIFCQSRAIRFTRYADDMTFSGGVEIENYIPNIRKTITKHGFVINEDKSQVLFRNQRQVVTGLVVNDKVAIKKEFIRKLSQEIHYCLRFGVSNHILNSRINKSNYKDHLFGRVYYIRMVNKPLGDILLKKLESIDWEY
ncbi:reverse transcriptase family protein [Paenibacillus rhizophilus]|nr:reverse transcriptase family protein [Paenibacillus rhizophilus]